MINFDQSVNIILDLEGGYVNNPDDSGGETNYGISKRSYPNEDIKNLTIDRAKEIYYKDYWLACRCDILPSPLNLFVFDCAVNQGVHKAITTLQKTLGVTVDGIIGTKTIAAASNVTLDQVAMFMTVRALTYASLSNFDTFGKGWFKRLFTITLKSQQ